LIRDEESGISNLKTSHSPIRNRIIKRIIETTEVNICGDLVGPLAAAAAGAAVAGGAAAAGAAVAAGAAGAAGGKHQH
jgi:hypothetical protein